MDTVLYDVNCGRFLMLPGYEKRYVHHLGGHLKSFNLQH